MNAQSAHAVMSGTAVRNTTAVSTDAASSNLMLAKMASSKQRGTIQKAFTYSPHRKPGHQGGKQKFKARLMSACTLYVHESVNSSGLLVATHSAEDERLDIEHAQERQSPDNTRRHKELHSHEQAWIGEDTERQLIGDHQHRRAHGVTHRHRQCTSVRSDHFPP
eukprot:scaffold265834_cov35-Tisochrysis_lutea.AAC.1